MKHSTFTDRSAFGAIRRLGFEREVALWGLPADVLLGPAAYRTRAKKRPRRSRKKD